MGSPIQAPVCTGPVIRIILFSSGEKTRSEPTGNMCTWSRSYSGLRSSTAGADAEGKEVGAGTEARGEGGEEVGEGGKDVLRLRSSTS